MLNLKSMFLALAMVCCSSAVFAQEKAADAKAADDVTAAVAQIDLNTATPEQLMSVKGIGEKKAADILALRKEKGCFASVDDLLAVKGIGEKTLLKLKPFFKAEGCTAGGGKLETVIEKPALEKPVKKPAKPSKAEK